MTYLASICALSSLFLISFCQSLVWVELLRIYTLISIPPLHASKRTIPRIVFTAVDSFLFCLPQNHPDCLVCPFFCHCQGYGRWAGSCETWRAVLKTLTGEARELRRAASRAVLLKDRGEFPYGEEHPRRLRCRPSPAHGDFRRYTSMPTTMASAAKRE